MKHTGDARSNLLIDQYSDHKGTPASERKPPARDTLMHVHLINTTTGNLNRDGSHTTLDMPSDEYNSRYNVSHYAHARVDTATAIREAGNIICNNLSAAVNDKEMKAGRLLQGKIYLLQLLVYRDQTTLRKKRGFRAFKQNAFRTESFV